MEPQIYHHYSLKNLNTFGISATCEAFADIQSVQELQQVLTHNTLPIQILGGGSNVLFLKEHYPKLFLKNSIKGIHIIRQTPDSATVAIGSGESWHDFVLWAIENDLGGVENLSLIPGTVGAAPIQNIGAYGVELKNVFLKLEALNTETREISTFSREECAFGYRDSIFKKHKKGLYFITKVFLRLSRKPHQTNSNYGDIKKILLQKGITQPTIRDISEAVIFIRQTKLPDPSVLGNAGSFFKNPEIPTLQFQTLQRDYPTIVGYPVTSDSTQSSLTKVAAGWLIEQCGWKGKTYGSVGVHERQALVLVHYGKGNGLQIKQLAERIQASVREKFGIELVPEVNMI